MMARGLLKDSSVTMLLQLMRTFGGLALLPPLISTLGSERFGLVALGITICTYASLLESVLTPVLRNELNIAVAQGQAGRAGVLHGVARTCALVLGAIATTITAALLGISTMLPALDWPLVSAVCIATIVTASIGSISDCIHSAQDRLWRIRVFELIATAAGFGLAYATRDLHAPALTLVCMCLVPQSGRALAWLVLDGSPQASEGATRLERVRASLAATRAFFAANRRDSLSFSTLQLLHCALATFPVILLSWRLSLSDTTVYTLVTRLMTAPASFIVALMPIAWPRITRFFNQGRADAVARIFPAGAMLIAVCLAIWCLGVLAFDDLLFGLLTHRSLAVPSPALIVAIGALVAANTAVAWVSTTLNAIGAFADQVWPTAAGLIALSVGAPVLLALCGLPGLALAAFLANALCIGLPTYLRGRLLLAQQRPIADHAP